MTHQAGYEPESERTEGRVVTTYVTVDDLVWMGDDSQWIGAQGHVDLPAFAEAANELSRRDAGLDDDELPSPEYEPSHVWFRPMTWEWYENHTNIPSRSAYAAMVADGCFEPCEPDDEGAEAWTMIATGA